MLMRPPCRRGRRSQPTGGASLEERAAKANRDGKTIPGLLPEEQRVRSCAIVLPREQHFKDHARHGLFAPPDTDPVTV